VKGPWVISVRNHPSGGVIAQLVLENGDGGPTVAAPSPDDAIAAVKDAWSAELHEHFTDQDFTVRWEPAVAEGTRDGTE